MHVERERGGWSGWRNANQPKNALMCHSEAPAAWASRTASPVLPGWPTAEQRERQVGVAQVLVVLEAAGGEDHGVGGSRWRSHAPVVRERATACRTTSIPRSTFSRSR